MITSLRIVGAQHRFSYSIDDGPAPIAKDAVDNYIGSVKLSQTHTLSYKNVTFNKIVVKKEAFQLPLIINLSVITNQQFHMSKAC